MPDVSLFEESYRAARDADTARVRFEAAYANAEAETRRLLYGHVADDVLLGRELRRAFEALNPVDGAGDTPLEVWGAPGRRGELEPRFWKPEVDPGSLVGTPVQFARGGEASGTPLQDYIDRQSDAVEPPGDDGAGDVDPGRFDPDRLRLRDGTPCDVSWEDPEVILEDVDYAFSLAFQNTLYAAVDGEGSLYVVFGYDPDIVLMRRAARSTSWESWTVAETAGSHTTPGIAADPTDAGKVWIVAASGGEIRVFALDFSGHGMEDFGRPGKTEWTVPSRRYAGGVRPSLAVDDDGTVHVAFAARPVMTVLTPSGERTDAENQHEQIFYAHMEGGQGGFSSPLQLSDRFNLTHEQPAVTVTEGAVVVVWRRNDSAGRANGLYYRVNPDSASKRRGFDGVMEMPQLTGSSASAGGNTLADPSAWSVPSGQVFTGMHDLDPKTGPWLTRMDLNSSSTQYTSSLDLDEETFQRGQFVHGAGVEAAGQERGLSAWMASSEVEGEYERQGIYGAVGCPGTVLVNAWKWSYLDEGDLTQSSLRDVVAFTASSATIEGVWDQTKDYAYAYLLATRISMSLEDPSLTDHTVIFEGSTISGRFAVTERPGGVYLQRLSGTTNRTPEQLAEDDVGMADTGSIIVYSEYGVPNQPTLALSEDGEVFLIWIQGKGALDILEQVDAGETPSVSLMVRRGVFA